MRKTDLWMVLIGLIAIISAILLVLSGKKPEFFDNFGVVAFGFLFFVGVWMLISKKKLPNWVGFVVLLVSVLGLIIDGSIVIKNFLLGG